MLQMTGLVEQRPPVVDAAHRLDAEHDACRHLNRGAKGPRILRRPRLDVELDVALGPEVDPEAVERRVERGQHAVGRVRVVPGIGTEQARDVPTPCLVDADPEAAAQQAVEGARMEVLGIREKAPGLVRERLQLEAEFLVEAAVGRGVQLSHGVAQAIESLAVEGVQLREQLDAGAVELLSPPAIRLVCLGRPQLPVADSAGRRPPPRAWLPARRCAPAPPRSGARSGPRTRIARGHAARRLYRSRGRAHRARGTTRATSGRSSGRRSARPRGRASDPTAAGSAPPAARSESDRPRLGTRRAPRARPPRIVRCASSP